MAKILTDIPDGEYCETCHFQDKFKCNAWCDVFNIGLGNKYIAVKKCKACKDAIEQTKGTGR